MITEKMLEALREFFDDELPADEWFMRHTTVSFDDVCHQVTIVIDNLNEQDYAWLRPATP